ncbi:MAG: thioredoxin family protein [Capsulimonadaceae bacterium]|nr:thioredoxin family protein [Capsulimonadaceae bacterium]
MHDYRIIVVAIMAAFLIASQPGATARAAAINHPAPAFSLPNAATGSTITLDSLRRGNHAVVLIFIATKCPVSNAYNDRMQSLAANYAAKGIAFAGINSNQTESTAEVAEHAANHKFTFPVLKDAGNVVADAYGARHTPEVFVVDSSGVLVYHGRIDDSMEAADVHSRDLANTLNEILAGQPVATPETKAFGCSIKRKPVQ